MLKLLGSLLILISATSAGFVKARQYENRSSQIRELILALQRLETEISYGYTPLPEALEKMAVQMKEPLRSLFADAAKRMNSSEGMTAQDILQETIAQHWGRTAMKKVEQEVLRQLSCTLGTSDRMDQMKHIALAAEQLKHEEGTAREEQNKYAKMSKSLGLLVGALVVILIF